MDAIDQWLNTRRGKFTASCNYKLLTPPDSKSTFSNGAFTYIEEKALEMCTVLWDRPELEENAALLHGKVHEFPAYEAYVHETKNYSMTYMGTENPVFLEYEVLEGESGGTPDVANITQDNKIDVLAEIKCPKNPVYHFRRLEWLSQWDIKENYKECYAQMQNLMLITGAYMCHFISYDERQISKKNKIKIIEVKPDLKFQDNLDLRIRLAVKEKYKILSKRMGVEIKDRAQLSMLQSNR